MQHFRLSFLVALLCLSAAFFWGGLVGVFIASILGILEVSLSFDNAVVNAAVLKRMSARWQHYFLTWGILIAVFGMRLVFPVLIVSVATGLGFANVAQMALEESRHLFPALGQRACPNFGLWRHLPVDGVSCHLSSTMLKNYIGLANLRKK